MLLAIITAYRMGDVHGYKEGMEQGMQFDTFVFKQPVILFDTIQYKSFSEKRLFIVTEHKFYVCQVSEGAR
jgi:hypothetical protein